MRKLLLAAAAAILGVVSVPAMSKEVQLTDQERTELRQKAEWLEQQRATARTQNVGPEGRIYHYASVKAHKVKQKAEHKARRAKRQVSKTAA